MLKLYKKKKKQQIKMAIPGNDTRTHLRNFTHLHLFVPYVCHTNAVVLGLTVVLDRASTSLMASEISY